jgi:hypothetical protein
MLTKCAISSRPKLLRNMGLTFGRKIAAATHYAEEPAASPIIVPARIRTCTNSHPVAELSGCTTIPLSTGKRSGERNHS